MLNKAKSERAKGPRHDPAVPLEEYRTPSVSKYEGLCRSCVRSSDCTFPRNELRPVRSCDEFDGGPPRRSSVLPSAAAPAATPVRQERADAHQQPEARGLCRTCARLSGCTFSKPAGGVWHCEEFE